MSVVRWPRSTSLERNRSSCTLRALDKYAMCMAGPGCGGPSVSGRLVVDRHAPVVARHPVGVGQVRLLAEDRVAGGVVHLPRGVRDLVEHDVLVVARDHALGEAHAVGVLSVELRGDALLVVND